MLNWGGYCKWIYNFLKHLSFQSPHNQINSPLTINLWLSPLLLSFTLTKNIKIHSPTCSHCPSSHSGLRLGRRWVCSSHPHNVCGCGSQGLVLSVVSLKRLGWCPPPVDMVNHISISNFWSESSSYILNLPKHGRNCENFQLYWDGSIRWSLQDEALSGSGLWLIYYLQQDYHDLSLWIYMAVLQKKWHMFWY